jgi:oligopeptide/dipeptide ABC transporter ATP-binding protein
MRARATAILAKVGLDGGAADRYPRQFSGGQRQRIAIARALIVSPRLVICDEAVSALDLSVQAQVLNLLLSLQEELSLSYLFISHDLSVVRHMAQRIVVLRGRVMEIAEAPTISSAPGHPYTQALLAASPVPDPDRQMHRRASSADRRKAETASPDPKGCPFAPRCPLASAVCGEQMPLLEKGPGGSWVACHHRDVALRRAVPASTGSTARSRRHRPASS